MEAIALDEPIIQVGLSKIGVVRTKSKVYVYHLRKAEEDCSL
jgi:hypothetical protein